MCEYKNTQGNKQMKTLGDTNSAHAQIPAMQRSENHRINCNGAKTKASLLMSTFGQEEHKGIKDYS